MVCLINKVKYAHGVVYVTLQFNIKYIGWAFGEHAVWSKYSNFDVAVHVPLMISIPMIMSDTNNYSAIPTDYTRCNSQTTNNGKVKNKIKSVHEVHDIKCRNDQCFEYNIEYREKYKQNINVSSHSMSSTRT